MAGGQPLPGGLSGPGIPLQDDTSPHVRHRIERLERILQQQQAIINDMRAVLFNIDSEGNSTQASLSNLTQNQYFNYYEQFINKFPFTSGLQYQFIGERGGFGTGNGQFDGSRGVGTTKGSISSLGTFFVADAGNDRIQVFDRGGFFLRAFGSSGTADGELDFPQGVALDNNSNVWVADNGNARLQKFNAAGTFQLKVTGLTGITWVACDLSGNCYVSQTGGTSIKKYNSSGTLSATIGSSGTGNGEFTSTTALACDYDNNLYVFDLVGSSNNRIQKFNSSGTYQSQIPMGTLRIQTGGDFDFDEDGYMWLFDNANNAQRLLRLDASGNVVWSWDRIGNNYGALKNNSAGIGISREKLVCINGGSTLQFFAPVAFV